MKPYLEVFKESLERSFKTWPLYAWQTGFEILRYITLLPCLLVAVWPLWKSRADFAGGDFSKLSDSLFNLIWASGWWMVALGMFALYFIWWLIIEAIVNGAVFGRLWAYRKRQEPFDAGKYFREGFRYLLPLLGLSLLAFIVSIVLTALMVLFVAGLGFLLASIGLSKGAAAVLILLVSLVVGLAATVVLVVLVDGWLIARGYVTLDHGLSESLRLSWRKCFADKGRVFWGINLLFLLIFAAMMGIAIPFTLLEMIPFVGVLFNILNILVSLVMAAFLAVYVPSVVVAFIDEKA